MASNKIPTMMDKMLEPLHMYMFMFICNLVKKRIAILLMLKTKIGETNINNGKNNGYKDDGSEYGQ